ncbi:MAG: hypothetical protein M1839_005438 [Geoglossum umbratile]|nr:MAG: hypothetical protein M1839_005438 [Geoglossum umbratile]
MSRHGFHRLMGPPDPPKPMPIDPPVTGHMGHRQISASSAMPLTSLFAQTQAPEPGRIWSAHPQRDGLPSPLETHAMVRWQTDSEEPWNPVSSGTGAIPAFRPISTIHPGTRSLGSYGHYRDNNVSEIGSIDTGTHPSDSGYATKSLTNSVFSGEPAEHGQDCSSVSGQIDKLHLVTEQPQCPPPYGNPERPRSVSGNICDMCGETFTCQSALKKHQLRHTKPHKCTVTTCPRFNEGFATINDRDRHITSVHKFKKDGISKSWRHLRRMHRDHNIEAIVRKCDQDCLVTEGEPVQDSYTSSEVSPPSKTIAHAGTLGQDSYISPQDLNEESPNSTIPEAGNIQTGLALPNGQRPDTSSDACDQNIEPFRELNYVPEDAPGNVQQTITKITEERLIKEDRTASVYPLGSAPAKEYGCSKTKPSENADGIPGQNTPNFDQGVEGSRLFTTASADVASTVAAMSPEITKVAASLTPRFLSKLAIEHEQERKNTGLDVIVIEDEDPVDVPIQPLDTTDGMPADKLPPNTRNNRLGQTGHCISTETMNISSGSDTPLSDRVKLQIEELLKSGLSNLLAKGARSARYSGTTVGGNHGPIHANKGKEIQCRYCKKVLPRDCDMNKHIKRHTRPYGCTYPNCNKLFGSKNDWKRHENTQHLQLEMWRCREKDNVNGKECCKLFYRRETFQQHLRQHHYISDTERLRDEARNRRIGRNRQIQFWCGFCRVVVPLKYRGLEAWDERFNHIGSHFAQNQKIDEWVPVDSDRPKGDTWPESTSMEGKGSRETEGYSPDQPSDDNANNRPSPENPRPKNPSQSPPIAIETIEPAAEEPSQYCCACGDGPWALAIHSRCPQCPHEFCDDCRARTFANPPRKRKRPQPRS